jgi:hypothetical protein
LPARFLTGFLACFLAVAFGLARAGLLMSPAGLPFLIAGSCRGASRFAQPRRCAIQIALEIAFDVSLEILPVVAMAVPAPAAAFTALRLETGLRACLHASPEVGLQLRFRVVETRLAAVSLARHVL